MVLILPIILPTSPDLSTIALKIKDLELDLLTNIEQHLFIKEEIKGGMAMISYGYAWANAPDMENYNASKRNSYIMHLNASNLYGWAMSKPLPTSNFKLLTDEEDLDVMRVPDDSSRG